MTEKTIIKVLIVDNNDEETFFLKEMLSGFYDMEIQSYIVKDLKSAISYLSENNVDSILLELNLPDSNSIETFKSIKNVITDDIPIIVYTDEKSKILAAKTMMNGGFDYLVKNETEFDHLYDVIKLSAEKHLHLSSEKTKILLIEDNKEEAYFIKHLISQVKDFEHEIIHYDNVTDAIRFIKEKSPNVILTDLVLPDAIGMETLKKLSEVTHEIPVIVLTGMDDEETALQALSHGAQDFLQKSDFNYELISRIIKYAIERKAKENQLKTATEKVKKLTKDKIQAEQLKAIHALMVTQNHEMNQPLAAILGQSWLMRAKIEKFGEVKTKEVLKYIDKIERFSERINTIIKELNNIEHVSFDSYANDGNSKVIKFGSNTGNKKKEPQNQDKKEDS